MVTVQTIMTKTATRSGRETAAAIDIDGRDGRLDAVGEGDGEGDEAQVCAWVAEQYQRLSGWMVAFVMRQFRFDHATAEDVAQTAWANLWACRRHWYGAHDPVTYVFATVRHCAYAELQARARPTRAPALSLDAAHVATAHGVAARAFEARVVLELADPLALGEHVERRELVRAVYACLQRVSPQAREALLLVATGYSVDEALTRLGDAVSRAAFHKMLQGLRQRLRVAVGLPRCPRAPMVLCPGCGHAAAHEARGLCAPCYQREVLRRARPCVACGRTMRLQARGLCKMCYRRARAAEQGVVIPTRAEAAAAKAAVAKAAGPVQVVCRGCSQHAPHRARGYCEHCYLRELRREARALGLAKSPKRQVVCRLCGREQVDAGRGLCSACWARARRREKQAAASAVGGVDSGDGEGVAVT